VTRAGGTATRPERSALCFAARGWRANVGCFRCLWAARDDAGQPDKTGLLKQINGAQEGKRMRERISGAEHGLQAVPVRSNKDSWPVAREHRGSYCSVAYGIKT